MRNLMMRNLNGMGMGLLIAAVLVVVLAGAVPANADTITFNLTSDHCTGGCGTPPFGTVTLTTSGANVDVTVHLFDDNVFVKTGSADFQNFKFNGIDVALGDITVNAHSPALVAATGAFNGDGTGNFAFGINCPSCANGGAGAFSADIEFLVANATIADLTNTTFNGSGIVFVADILSGSTGNTGPVDATTGSCLEGCELLTPEPASLLLLGSGLAGLGLWGRKRRREIQA